MSVGHSVDHTPRKQEKFDSIMRMWFPTAMAVARRSFDTPRLRVIDTTAGSGWVGDHWGSPVRVLHTAREVGVREFQLVCIERHADTFAELADSFRERYWKLYTDHEPALYHGDCRDILPALPPGYDPQLVYYDPNGADWPTDDLARFCARGRTDLLIHVSATAAKRNRRQRLDRALDEIPKNHKAIWVDTARGWQWCFVIATNWPNLLRKFKGRQDFHDITSDAGRQLLDLVSTTQSERLGRTELRPC